MAVALRRLPNGRVPTCTSNGLGSAAALGEKNSAIAVLVLDILPDLDDSAVADVERQIRSQARLANVWIDFASVAIPSSVIPSLRSSHWKRCRSSGRLAAFACGNSIGITIRFSSNAAFASFICQSDGVEGLDPTQ
jgi:hypothetical protein